MLAMPTVPRMSDTGPPGGLGVDTLPPHAGTYSRPLGGAGLGDPGNGSHRLPAVAAS